MNTTTPKRPPAARSKKIRPNQQTLNADQSRLGSFPPPTEWSEQLAADNLQLACAMASRLSRATKMPFDDLYLVAAVGLLKGCRKYDPTRLNPDTGKPYRLATCVVKYIQGAMAQWLRDRGHSSGVKFPDRWRDKAPTVRRLAKSGSSHEEIANTIGFSVDEVREILEAQGATRNMGSYFGPAGLASFDPDPWDEAETYEELSEALRIADEAHAALSWADREMIETAWEGKRHQLARLPHGQFLVKARSILRGEQQQTLSIVVPESDPKNILEAAKQLALGLNQDMDGKTQAAGLEIGAAPGDQPPDE